MIYLSIQRWFMFQSNKVLVLPPKKHVSSVHVLQNTALSDRRNSFSPDVRCLQRRLLSNLKIKQWFVAFDTRVEIFWTFNNRSIREKKFEDRYAEQTNKFRRKTSCGMLFHFEGDKKTLNEIFLKISKTGHISL